MEMAMTMQDLYSDPFSSASTGRRGACSLTVDSQLSPLVLSLLADAERTLKTDIEATRAALGRATDLLLGRRPDPDSREVAPRMGGLAPWQARRISAYIDDNIDRAISIETLAGIAALSCSYLCRAFKVTFGEPPHVHVMRRRVERAKAMMLETREPLSQIATACGFSDQAHLCRLFRRAEGASPNRWRRQHWVEGESLNRLAA
jgi:AraC family transcriptional regulator